jgi:predicted dehydrogenase
MSKLRIAVVGAGAFGRNHMRVIRSLPEAELTAVCDTDPARAAAAAAEFGCRALPLAELAGAVDAAIVAVPTFAHAEVGCALLAAGIDVLVEKPIAPTLEAADALIRAATNHGRILQVGHLERFNPAVTALAERITVPLFFEIHRLSLFTPRALDVDVVLDLMIHDIDILLALTGRMPEEVRAAGISILSDKVDIANVRLAFPGGCVANVTASRVYTERVRKMRLFQPHQYISLDYQKQEAVAFSVSGDRQIGYDPFRITKAEPLALELAHFVACVTGRTTPRVDGVEARKALAVSLDILHHIEVHARTIQVALAAHPTQL